MKRPRCAVFTRARDNRRTDEHRINGMKRPRVLFICGSMNQTTQMHQIAAQLGECDGFFTNYFDEGYPNVLKRLRLAEMTPLGYKLSARTLAYLERHHLPIDESGRRG